MIVSFRARLGHVVVAAVAVGLLSAPAAASAAAPPVSETPEVVVILDSSGSMAEADAGGGQTRMDAAKQAVTELATSTPDTTRIALRTYGDGVDSQAAGSCEDTTLRVPVGPVDRDAITAQVDELQPRGDTPIGTALLAAASDFTGGGPQSVVLVSDGEPTCDPDPCPVAAQLADQGIDLRIDVIGFRVDDTAREILECIADAGNGQYVDAADAGELAQALDTSANRGFRVYRPEGTPITGGLDAAGAATLGSGQHLDTMTGNEKRYYAVHVPLDWTLRAGITLTRGDDPERRGVRGMLVTRMYTSGDEPWMCTQDLGTPDNQRGTAPLSSSVLIGSGTYSGLNDDYCDPEEQFLLEVEWRGSSNPGPVAMEIVVELEPPVVGTEGTGTRTDPTAGYPSIDPLPDPAPVDGGSSFNDATELGRGAWSDSMRVGEAVFYRVPVDWGQQLAVRVDFAPSGEGSVLDQAGLGRGTYAHLGLFDQARGGVFPLQSDNKRVMTMAPFAGRDDFMSITTHPVVWANRQEPIWPDVRSMSRPGDVFLVLSMGSDSTTTDAEGLGIPYTVSVDLLGERQPGPRYETADTPTPADASTPAEESTPASTPGPAPSTEPEPQPSELEAAPAAAAGGGPLVPLLVVAAVLLSVALVGLVVYGVRSSRRPRPAAST